MSLKSRKLRPEVLARRIDPVKAAALHEAIAADDLGRISALLAAGASPSSRNRAGWPALHAAAAYGFSAIVTRVLEAGADIDAVANTEELIDRQRHVGTATALMVALRAGHEGVALLLLERGASIDHVDTFSKVDALFLAAEQGFESAVERILLRGPARQARLFNEKNALDAAVEIRHAGIVRRLLGAGFAATPAAERLAASG